MKKNEVSKFLENVAERTHLYISPVSSEKAEDFLSGFVRGVLVANSNIEYIDYINSSKKALAQSNYNYGSMSLRNGLTKSGVSEEKIIQELLKVEIETWRILEDNQEE